MMPKLTKFTGNSALWTITDDPTGLEYAAKLQSFTAPGKNPATGTANGSFTRFINTLATDRGQIGTPIVTLKALDLSGYPKEVFLPASTSSGIPTFPAQLKLTSFTATEDGLTGAQLNDPKTSDLAAFLQQLPPATLNVSAKEPTDRTANSNNIPALLTGIPTIKQANMLGPSVVLSLVADNHDAAQLILTTALDDTKNRVDLRTTLDVLNLMTGQGGKVSAADAQAMTVAFFDQGDSKQSDTNADLTTLVDKDNPGQLNINYQKYLTESKTKTGKGFLRFTLTRGESTYSVWLPTTIKGEAFLGVTGSLKFGTRHLTAGNYPNDGHNDITGANSDGKAEPIKITTVHYKNAQVSVAASAFTTTQSTVSTFTLKLGDHEVPANGTNSVAFPELAPSTELITTQEYAALLKVPNTAGIIAGQPYEAKVTYTLTSGL